MGREIQTLELPFSAMELHEYYVVSTLREGTFLEQKEVKELITVCTEFYKGKDFVYISRRIYDYNVNPVIYFFLKEVKNLKGIGIVCKQATSAKTANFEKSFSNIPFEVFLEFDDAVEWAKHLVNK